MTHVFSALQLLGLLAVLVGVALLLPLGAALVVDGVAVVVGSTVAEVVARRALSARSEGRSRPKVTGVA
jgi:membrane protein implicated in regulation of membrane protease activity